MKALGLYTHTHTHTNSLRKEKGITLIGLVITIIVLLILAGVTILALSGENGILTRASNTKIETAVATVKENLRLEQIEKTIDEEKVTPETLLAEGRVKRTVQQAEDENYYMYYALKEDAVEGMQGLGKGNPANLKDVFLIDDNLNVKYMANDGKEYGDNINNKILEDETEIRFASKAFSEYVSKISGVTEEEMKFKWMKNRTSLTIADTSVDSLEDLVFFPNLENLTLGDSNGNNSPNITTMDGIENCMNLKSLFLNNVNIESFKQLSNLNEVTKISLLYGNNNIKDLINTIEKLSTLQTFILNYAGGEYDYKIISDLPVSLTSLTIRGAGDKINKIEGIEHLTNLTYLQMDNNKINTIKGIEKLTQLISLNLTNNQITDITPLSANTSLTTLNLKGNTGIDGNRANYTGERLEALNKIGEILDRGGTINLDIDKLGLFTNYTSLNLSNQNLTTLEQLDGLTQLTTLDISNNQITLEDTRSQEILRSMQNLTTLNIVSNPIKDITVINDLKGLKSLTMYDISVNLKEIEDIISNLNVLKVSTESLKTIANCSVNKITQLYINSSRLTEIPDLSKFTMLTKLGLADNSNITNFEEVSKIKSLQYLDISQNNLHGRMIDFSKLTNLTNLKLRNNTLWSEDLENLKALKNNTNLTIDLSKNSIIDASALLELNPNTKINLTGNINLSLESKTALKAHFKNNVTF